MLLYQEPFVRMYFYKENRVFEIEWLDFVGSENFKTTLNTALRLSSQHGAQHWLANNRLMRTLRVADQQWTSDVWFKDFSKSGCQKLAIVESEDAMNRMSISNIMNRAGKHNQMETRYFQHRTQAWQWLSEPVSVTSNF